MADAFSAFGFGRDAVPLMFRRMLENGGDVKVAEAICNSGGSDAAKFLNLVMEEAAGTPPHRLAALASSLGLISPYTGEPTVPGPVRTALSIPPQVKVKEFVEVAGRSALALAMTVARDNDDVPSRLSDLVERVKAGSWALSLNALEEASKQSWRWEGDDLVAEGPREGKYVGVARITIRKWQRTPEFRHMALEIAGHCLHGLHKRGDGTIAAAPMTIPVSVTDKVIRQIAMRFPVADIMRMAGEVPTVWSATPSNRDRVRQANRGFLDL